MSSLLPFTDLLQNFDDSVSEIPSENSNRVYGNHSKIYQDLAMVKPLKKGEFPIFLVKSKVTKKNYVMKIFPQCYNQPHFIFQNEIRFASLQHQHLVRNLFFKSQSTAFIKEEEKTISYIIMEYASHGNFMKFLRNYSSQVDDTLARTYFRQLIEGLEYLHNHGVAHMDLKLENLLIHGDYDLKITGLDQSYFAGDAILLSKGTGIYRAPEVIREQNKEPQKIDIYAAGMILFMLKANDLIHQFDMKEFSESKLSSFLESWLKYEPSNPVEKDFQNLFLMMTNQDANSRATIQEIKNSKWYNGPVYSSEELKINMFKIFSGATDY